MPGQLPAFNILIVDDDEVDVRAIRRGLEKQRINNPVFVAHDGQEGLDMLRGDNGCDKVPRPYLILLDLNMPRMNGVQFLKELRADPSVADSVVVVLTTSSADEDKLAASRQQVAGYLVKSESGIGFLKVVQLLQQFVSSVQFPP